MVYNESLFLFPLFLFSASNYSYLLKYKLIEHNVKRQFLFTFGFIHIWVLFPLFAE